MEHTCRKMAISEPSDARIHEQLMEFNEVVNVTMMCICSLQSDKFEEDLEICAFGSRKPSCREPRSHREETRQR